jgi:hypothetical protein
LTPQRKTYTNEQIVEDQVHFTEVQQAFLNKSKWDLPGAIRDSNNFIWAELRQPVRAAICKRLKNCNLKLPVEEMVDECLSQIAKCWAGQLTKNKFFIRTKMIGWLNCFTIKVVVNELNYFRHEFYWERLEQFSEQETQDDMWTYVLKWAAEVLKLTDEKGKFIKAMKQIAKIEDFDAKVGAMEKIIRIYEVPIVQKMQDENLKTLQLSYANTNIINI